MSDQHQSGSANQSHIRNRSKAKVVLGPEQTGANAKVAQLPPGRIGAEAAGGGDLDALWKGPQGVLGGGSLENQLARLSDPRLRTVQRQALATHIGQVQGNRFLQARIAALDRERGLKMVPKRGEVQDGAIQRQQAGAQGAPPSSERAKEMKRIFQWLEKPLQAAVKSPSRMAEHPRDPKRRQWWSDDAIAALVLVYNKMRREDVWQYVDEVWTASRKVSINILPKGGQASLPQKLVGHGYGDYLASWRVDWGLRKKNACGPHLHFKHFKASDRWVEVHIDQYDPCCTIPDLIRHILYEADPAQFAKRRPGKFLRLLAEQHVPLSTGILKYLKEQGYLSPVLKGRKLHGQLSAKLNRLAQQVRGKGAAQAELDEGLGYLRKAGAILWKKGGISEEEMATADEHLSYAAACASGAEHSLSSP